MANNVVAQVLGGTKQVLDNVHTVLEIKEKLNAHKYTAAINGDSASDDDSLNDGDFVSLSQAVKGGRV
jgi:sulfur carrier protein ThiS